MVPFDIIPKGRSKGDVDLYKFLRWYMRRHRREIENITNRVMDEAIDEWVVTGAWRIDTKYLDGEVLRYAQENFSPEAEGFERL